MRKHTMVCHVLAITKGERTLSLTNGPMHRQNGSNGKKSPTADVGDISGIAKVEN